MVTRLVIGKHHRKKRRGRGSCDCGYGYGGYGGDWGYGGYGYGGVYPAPTYDNWVAAVNLVAGSTTYVPFPPPGYVLNNATCGPYGPYGC